MAMNVRRNAERLHPNDEDSYGAYFFGLGYGLGMTAIQCSDACEMVPYEEESKGDSYAICKCDTATYTDYCDEFGMLHMCDGGAELVISAARRTDLPFL